MLSKCWTKKSIERPSFEEIVQYLMLVEDNSDNFGKFSALHQYYDISIAEKKPIELSSKNSDELTSSFNSDLVDSKENTN